MSFWQKLFKFMFIWSLFNGNKNESSTDSSNCCCDPYDPMRCGGPLDPFRNTDPTCRCREDVYDHLNYDSYDDTDCSDPIDNITDFNDYDNDDW